MSEKRKDQKGRSLRLGESERKNGGYTFRYSHNGKRLSVYAPTLNELRDREKEIQKSIDENRDYQRGLITLNKAFEIYMSKKTKLRETTATEYRNVWRFRVKDSDIGNMKIADIQPYHVSDFYNGLLEIGLARGTISGYHKLVSGTLKMCVKNRWILNNPAEYAFEDIGGKTAKKESLTRNEQNSLTAFLNASDRFAPYGPLVNFALATGLRSSELCGLQWSDISFQKSSISVSRQLIYKNCDGQGMKYIIQEPKSAAGVRTIPLTDRARKALKGQRDIDSALGLTFAKCETCGYKDYVFTASTGNPRNTRTLDTMLNKIVDVHNQWEERLCDLPHISMHILRHTALTRWAESGISAKTLQTIAGHSDISVTLNTYVKLDDEAIRNEVNAAEERLAEII